MDLFRLEALQPGRDGLIRPLADAGVAGRHLDPIERRCPGPPSVGIELQSRVLEMAGPMDLQQDKQQHQAATDQDGLQGFLAVEQFGRFDHAALASRVAEQQGQEWVRLGIAACRGCQLGGRDQAILQLRVALLDGAGDPDVADPSSQGTHHQPAQGKSDDQQGGPAGQQEDFLAVVPIVDSGHGGSHRQQGKTQPPGKAPNGSDALETPADSPDGGLQALPFRCHG